VEQESENPDNWPLDAVGAIILAAASTEAFINEFAEVHQNPKLESLPLRACSDALVEIERDRGSLRLKYLVASRMLSGKMFDKGSAPYQDFDVLVQLRNDLMHLKPLDKFNYSEHGLESMTVPKYIKALQQRGLARTFGPDAGISWFDSLCTGEMAKWSCETARAIILEVLTMVPDEYATGFKHSFERQV
jgi:hypothetical protein